MNYQVLKKPIIRKISRGNQVTLPPKFVSAHHLDAGDPIEMIEQGDYLIIRVPAFSKNAEREKVIENIKTLFQEIDYNRESEGVSHLSEEDIMKNVIQEIKLQRHP